MRTISARVRLQLKRWWPLLAAAILAAGAPGRAADPPPALEILFHADLDGRFASPRCGKPGADAPDEATIVAALAAARTQAPEALTLAGRQLGGPRSVRRRAAGTGRGARR